MAGLTAAFGFPYNSQFLLSGHSCCDSGTGQLAPHSPQTPHVCSCQLEQVLHQKMNTLPLGLLPNASFSSPPNLVFGPAARDPSTLYPPLVRHCDVKDMGTGGLNPAAWFINPRFDPHSFDRSTYLACRRFGDRFSPIDINSGARRKNATRETTSTLKAWLYEHRKNPYPTKGEKIMLAILTKMTLTQVSTWFANARRRLKKENKMTWSPRNRCGERKDSEGYSDDDEDNDEEEEEKIDDLVEEPERSLCRKTTVIKSLEDTKNAYHHTDPTQRRETEVLNTDQPLRNRELLHPQRPNQRIIWQSERSPVETDRARTQEPSPLEDSPVKSLRKWVDGCFDQTHKSTVRTPVTDTPPLTPPSDTERLGEKAAHSTELEKISSRKNSGSPGNVHKADVAKTSKERSNDDEGDGTTNREIDAALALTTLFSRS